MQAAVNAGYRVIALDAFADKEVRSIADQWHVLPYGNGSFDQAALQSLLPQILDLQPSGFVYGSGFEANSALLAMVEQAMPLIGNSGRVVRNTKRALTFFALLDVLNIKHPVVSLQPLDAEQYARSSWLLKRNGGSGGTHVRTVSIGMPVQAGEYYQQMLEGIPVSLLFAADGHRVREIGYNQQWLAPTASMPYRYGGAVSHAVLPQAVKRALLEAAQKLTSAVGLRGINSIDALMQGEAVYILELNPRLTATFDLYTAHQAQLFDLHVQAATGKIPDGTLVNEDACAHYIVYAHTKKHIPSSFSWPDWVADIPVDDARIETSMPICTVKAAGDTAEAAVRLMADRVKQLMTSLN